MSTTPHTPTLPTPPADVLRELLTAWFIARDELYDAEAADAITHPAVGDAHHVGTQISQQAVIDLADELVALFVPDVAARCALTGESVEELHAPAVASPAPGQPVSCILSGHGRVAGDILAVDSRTVLIQWRSSPVLPIRYARDQIVPTAHGWHVRRT